MLVRSDSLENWVLVCKVMHDAVSLFPRHDIRPISGFYQEGAVWDPVLASPQQPGTLLPVL